MDYPEKPKFHPPSTQDSNQLKKYQAEHLKKIEEWKSNLEEIKSKSAEIAKNEHVARVKYWETLKSKLDEFRNLYTSQNFPPCPELPELIRTSLNYHTNWPEKFIIQKIPILAKD